MLKRTGMMLRGENMLEPIWNTIFCSKPGQSEILHSGGLWYNFWGKTNTGT